MRFFLIISFLILSLHSFSQNGKSNIFFEALGNGIVYSINYERSLIDSGRFDVSPRVGGSYCPKGLCSEHGDIPSLVIGAHFISKFSEKHHLDIGTGFTYFQNHSTTFSLISFDQIVTPRNFLLFVPSIGYRFDKNTKGLNFRISYTPLIILASSLNRDIFFEQHRINGEFINENEIEDLFDSLNQTQENILPAFLGISIGYRF